MPFWLFSKTARWGQGVGPFLISALRHYVEDVKNGAFAFEGGVTDTVEALTGMPAESFETTARRYAALPFARQSLGNRLKSLVKFSIMPLLPGYDLERLERQWGFPQPPKPTPRSGTKRGGMSTAGSWLGSRAPDRSSAHRRCGWRHDRAAAVRNERRLRLCRLGERIDALRPLLVLHAFRFIGLSFLVPGVVSPDLPLAFARDAAFGDIVAAILALA